MFHTGRLPSAVLRGIHRRRTRRRWAAVGLACAALATSVVVARPASAAAAAQWQRGLNAAWGALAFDSTHLTWLDSTTVRWGVSTGPDCWPNALATFSV